MNLLFASQNRHKRDELEHLIAPHTLSMPNELDIDYYYEETADTLIENSLGKAMHLHKLSNKITIADDTGLFVDALNGIPGVHTARYGEDVFNRSLTSREQCEFLLENLKDVKDEQRSARFICTIALVISPHHFYLFTQSIEGMITTATVGTDGFGYDPIFYVPSLSKTLSQIPITMKNEISHRGKATRDMLIMLQGLDKEKLL
jgi:XTP/dITP diphosphohydrolase